MGLSSLPTTTPHFCSSLSPDGLLLSQSRQRIVCLNSLKTSVQVSEGWARFCTPGWLVGSWHECLATRPCPCSRSQPLTSRLLCCSTPASSTTATKSFRTGWACWPRNTGARRCPSPAKGAREGKLGLSATAGITSCFALAGCLGTQHLLCPVHGLRDGTGLVWRAPGSRGAPVDRASLRAVPCQAVEQPVTARPAQELSPDPSAHHPVCLAVQRQRVSAAGGHATLRLGL